VSIQRRAKSTGYGIYSILVEEFHAVFNGRDKPAVLIPKREVVPAAISSSSSNNDSVLGGRPRRRAAAAAASYFEDLDVLICRDYSESLDALLVMEITEWDLKFYLFDNQSWNLLRALTNLNLITRKIEIIQPGIFSVTHFANKIMVRRNKSESDSNAHQIILIPLLTESTA